MDSRFNDPPPLILRKSCPIQYSCIDIAGWGYLIKMHSYMMPQFNTCRISQYTIGNNSNLKHNTTKSMVGPLPLAPHHDYLQYMYHVYLMQMGSKLGCYIPPPPSLSFGIMPLLNLVVANIAG